MTSAALSLALATGAPAILALTSPAGAQSVDGLRAEADQLSSELSELRGQVESHAEDYNRARARAADAEAEVQRFSTELGATRADVDHRRQQLAAYAVQAYVQGGDVPAVNGLVSGEPDDLTRRLSYLRTAAGDRKALVDRLRVSEEDLAERIARVDAARAEAATGAEEADRARQEAETAEARIGELLGQVQGRLGALLAEQEAQRAAEEARQAEAARQATAAEAAARSADASTATDEGGTGQSLAPAARPTTPAPSGSASGAAAVAVEAAMSQLGVPYVYGGASPGEGFDCSGLIQWAWGVAGRSLSHAADWQRDESEPISEAELRPGDLVFYGEPPSHDAMYIGDGMIINAPYTGEVVRVQSMYYSSKPMTFGRVN